MTSRERQVEKIKQLRTECRNARKNTPHFRDLCKHLKREEKALILYDKLRQENKEMAKAGRKQLDYIGKWNKENTKAIIFRLNKKKDADILQQLQKKGVAPYLKKLVRADMENAGAEGYNGEE